jgi:hypothetical protein
MSPTLLIHEATDAYIPRSVDPQAKRALGTVKEKALSRGHSTPDMAGAFAKKIKAEKLMLNHIGGRFAHLLYSSFMRSFKILFTQISCSIQILAKPVRYTNGSPSRDRTASLASLGPGKGSNRYRFHVGRSPTSRSTSRNVRR